MTPDSDSPSLVSAAPPPLVQNVGATVVLLATAGLFALIARKVEHGETQELDQRVHERLQANRLPALDAAAKPVTLLSIPILIVSATASLVWWLHRDGRTAAAVAVAVTPIAVAAVGQSFTSLLEQRNPPDTGASPVPGGVVTEPSFPSGHTTGVTAEALSIAYILQQEGLATPPILAALLGWPVVVGLTRIYRDRHWISDAVAGWVAGTAVAAVSALLYGAIARSGADTRQNVLVER